MLLSSYHHQHLSLLARTFLLFLLFLLPWTACGDQSESIEPPPPPPRHFNIILIGATGDLAQKYLWTGIFTLFRDHYEKGVIHVSVYACARSSAEQGRKFISDIFLYTLKCSDGEDLEDCREDKKKFAESTQYHELKTDEDYSRLADMVTENTRGYYAMLDTPFSYEEGRLVYLAIPPSAYSRTVYLVHRYLRPRHGRPWLRLVIEKPFGRDLASAAELEAKLGKYFQEQQIYRIDHYLGKAVVRHIMPFRYINRDIYEKYWNRDYIERVEIVLKENIDVKGRLDFYEDVGVVRDMMQSHATELLTMVAMDLPNDSGSVSQIRKNKLRLLEQLRLSSPEGVLYGQYSTYAEELRLERNSSSAAISSRTPTFAAARIRIPSARWRDVPFLLVSGKKLDVKVSYARVMFRDAAFCVRNDAKNCGTEGGHIVFYIGGSDLRLVPMIAATRSLGKPKPGNGWWLADEVNSTADWLDVGTEGNYWILPEVEPAEPYHILIRDVFLGERHRFLDGAELMLSWKLWSEALELKPKEAGSRLRLYEGGKRDSSRRWLDFRLAEDDGLEYLEKEQPALFITVPTSENAVESSFRQIPSQFRDRPLVSGKSEEEILDALAKEVLRLAETSVLARGDFHLALSGGRALAGLLKRLKRRPTFPWLRTHLWFVDERCVPPNSLLSNFEIVRERLLAHVDIPYCRIHPMPIEMSSGEKICDPADSGDEFYESLIRRFVARNGVLDLVVLGVGNDGHTASLFPHQPSLEAPPDRLVVFASGGPSDLSPQRLTMTLTLLNRAENVAVVVTGSHKHSIVVTLSEGLVDVEKHPITGVQPVNGNMTWFIDLPALFGDDH